MATPACSWTREEVVRWVHEALDHLYDLPTLQRNPLAAALADEENAMPSQHLRHVLLDLIQAVRPGKDVPDHARDWRRYRLLKMRYIEGASPNEVMSQLALSRAQYFREQAAAVEALATALWNQVQQQLTEQGEIDSRQKVFQAETERLYAHATREMVDPDEVLRDLRIVEPLAKKRGVVLSWGTLSLEGLRADRVILRQALVGALSAVLALPTVERVEVTGDSQSHLIAMTIRARLSTGDSATTDQEISLALCNRLMEVMGGRASLEQHPGLYEVRLTWPKLGTRLLLVVDDNQGLVELFRRYLVGHGWQVLGANDGAQARQVLAENRPTVISLDVLMPKEDGWDLLVAFRNDVRTRDIPIIVCSVAEQEQLALTLGATAFLPKPFSQEDLLRLLKNLN